MRGRHLAPLIVVALLTWAVWSWQTGGLMSFVLRFDTDSERAIAELRQWFASAGPLAPIVYVAAVTVEVMLAPVPGLLLYAPGGAIFGGLLGGTLALVGNVIGAALAAWIAARLGEGWRRSIEQPRLQRIVHRLQARSMLVIVLLRINPLTSSDLVSYAAGLAGVPVWRVAVATAVGIAPLCYAQAYASEWIFRVLPGSVLLVVALVVAYVLLLAWLLFRGTLSGTRNDA